MISQTLRQPTGEARPDAREISLLGKRIRGIFLLLAQRTRDAATLRADLAECVAASCSADSNEALPATASERESLMWCLTRRLARLRQIADNESFAGQIESLRSDSELLWMEQHGRRPYMGAAAS